MVGRPERPLDPTTGILQSFAHDLRKVRLDAGSPKYRTLARAAGYSASSLSAAASGWSMPTLALTLAYVGACGGDLVEWERRWHEAIAGLDAERATPEQPAERTAPRQVPVDVRGFVGRERELAELDRLRGCGVPVVTVGGPGGVGRSALAVRWAHRGADRFPDGQLYADLRGHGPGSPARPAEVLVAFLRGLGVDGGQLPPTVDERVALYRDLLADRRVLVLLHGAHSTEQVRPLLPGSPSCFVVITGIPDLDGVPRIGLEPLPLPDAVRLLAARAGDRVRADPVGAARLAERCARLPLALRVAAELAARPGATLSALGADLSAELAGGDGDADRPDPLRAVLSRSYRNLPAPAARMFGLLGRHPGGDVDLASAAALAGTDPAQTRAIVDVLTHAHLVQPTTAGRFGMHDLIRAYAVRSAAPPDRRQAPA
jgi:hypothetical protein